MNDPLWQHIIYRCIIGSRAYGLDDAESDTDRRGIYLPPADLHWSLAGVPEQLENEATQECYWEIEKFINLALKANPNILECLYTPLVELATPLAQELLIRRDAFLSKRIYDTYQGYVQSQFKRLEMDLRSRGQIRWKHAMHLIRLQIAGIQALHEGTIQVDMAHERDRLMQIKHGELPWSEIDRWRTELGREFEAAHAMTKLPEEPNYEWANAFLIKARRHQAELH